MSNYSKQALEEYLEEVFPDYSSVINESPDYEKIGYQIARRPHSNLEKLEQRKNNLSDEVGGWIEEISKQYEEQQYELAHSANQCQTRIETYEADLTDLRNRARVLREQIRGRKEEKEEEKETIRDSFKRIGELRKNFYREQLEKNQIQLKEAYQARKEQIKDLQLSLDEKAMLLLEQHGQALSEIADDTKSFFKKLQRKVFWLFQVGINGISSGFLVSLGALGAIMSGYFFSAYYAESPIPEATSNSFTVGILGMLRYLQAIEEGWDSPLSKILGALALVVLLLGVLWMITKVIEWFQKKLFDWDKKLDDTKVDLPWGYGKEKTFTGKNAISIWLQTVPFVLVISIIFIFISFSTGQEDIDKVVKTIDGQLLGSIFSLLMGGISFLYVVKVVEPRTEHIDPEDFHKNKRAFWTGFLELVFLLLGFITLFTFLIFGKDLFTQIRDVASASLIFYLLASLFSGLLLGYGIRHRSIIQAYEAVGRQIRSLYYRAAQARVELPVAPWMTGLQDIDQKLLQTQETLVTEMLEDLKADRYHDEGATQGSIQNVASIIRQIFSFLRFTGSSNRTIPQLQVIKIPWKGPTDELELTPFMVKYFPEETAIIVGCRNRIKEISNQIQEWEKEALEIELETSEQIKSLKTRKKEDKDELEFIRAKETAIGPRAAKEKQKLQLILEDWHSKLEEGFQRGNRANEFMRVA